MLREASRRETPGATRYRLLDVALRRRLLADPVLRAGSWLATVARERHELRGGVEAQEQRQEALLERMRSGPIAEQTAAANEQHYELPAEFFGLVLGPRRKYSCCLWEPGAVGLSEAEDAMLELTCERAEVRDGMRILDLGCGWGSLSLWISTRYPNAEITAVSNSNSQRQFIEARRDDLKLSNLRVVTADVNEYHPDRRFDRVVSIEMFEHMRNWEELLRRISTWLEPDGSMFMHVFSHRTAAYTFEGTWASERFFTAGMMPSHELPLRFQEHLKVDARWAVSGTHYAKTLEAWLTRLDDRRAQAIEILRGTGRDSREAQTLLESWRLFLISTAVIWGYDSGNRWMVSHYRFSPRAGA